MLNGSQNVRADCWNSFDKRPLKMEDMEDLGENSPNFQSNSRLNTCRCCNKTVFGWLTLTAGDFKSARVFNWIRNCGLSMV